MGAMPVEYRLALKGRRARFLVLTALLAALPYLNSLSAGFTFDDAAVVRDNPAVMHPDAPLRPLVLGVIDRLVWYRPLTMLSYRANAAATRTPFGFHLVNVLLHVVISMLVFELAALWVGHGFAAFATAALFAVHPIHTEAVSSIVGRAELMAALFVFGSLLAIGRVRECGSVGWIVASVGCFLLGLLSKESAVVGLPLAVVVCRRSAQQLSWPRVGVLIALLLVAAMPYLYLRGIVVGALTLPAMPDFLSNPVAYSPWPVRLAMFLVIASKYSLLMFAPIRLYADYSFNHLPVVSDPTDPRLVGAVIGLAFVAVVLFLVRRREPLLLVASIFFFLPLGLTSNIGFAIGTIMAERLLYLPSFGFCFGLGVVLARWAKSRGPLVVTVLILCVAVLSLRTVLRNEDWQDDCSLFLSAIRSGTGSAKSYLNLAVCYQDHGELDTALTYFGRALDIYADFPDAAFGIGFVHELKGDEDLALEWYRRTLGMAGGYAKAHLNTGSILYQRGDAVAAEREFRSGLEAEPENPRLLLGLALARLVQNDRDSATVLLQRATALAGDNPRLAGMVRDAAGMLKNGAPNAVGVPDSQAMTP